MKMFMDKDFMLDNEVSKELYFKHAANLPIIDYHCHLNPEFIAKDRKFDNLGQIWLEEDHYKWRAMRTNGIEERFCTGKDTTDWEKFEKWAYTVPYTMRNPLYHWTHLELQKAFGINTILKPETAREIYDECTAKLQTPEFSARGLMRKFKVEVVCTTDDPIDSLKYHIALQKEGFGIKVLPTWRPDKVTIVENPDSFRTYIEKLSDASGVSISKYSDVIDALQVQHDFFASVGCRLSDHGLEEFYAEDYTDAQIRTIFDKIYGGKNLTKEEILKFKSAILVQLAYMDFKSGWVQQFHYGPMRDNNSRLFAKIGADRGFDSMCDLNVAKNMSKFLDRLDSGNMLAKTIIYNLNPSDNEMVAAMIGNFQDGSVAGKIQFGAGWWFLDQKFGMTAQMNSLSALGLLSRFVGMLTDSRSFLSYPRHEYFRRIMCNLIGTDVVKGEIPATEMDFLGKMVEGISYYNAKNFFEF
jgi:glucuronate isomerase